MNLAYLVNQYPKTSHSFIRREILAIEAANITVHRFAIRAIQAEIVDEADKQEAQKTRYILSVGAKGLLLNLIRVAVTRPLRFIKTALLTLRIGFVSERGVLINLAYFAEACVLLKWFAEDGITHVHNHFGTNSATVAMLCRLLGGPSYSMTVHGPEEFDNPVALSLSTKVRYASFVVAVCSFGKSQLYRWCDYQDWSKIKVIHCGVDEMFLKHPAVAIPSQPRFVCVGRLCKQKGHLVLFEAVKQLATEGRDFKLVMVGDGPLRNQIEALVQESGLEKYVEITGWATNTEVQQQILAAQVMVVPSFAEGLPVVIMESLASQRPVISTYVAGIPELVQPGKSGWLVPAGSVEELVNSMRIALQTPIERLEEMGKAGAILVAKNHDVAGEAGKLIELFNTINASSQWMRDQKKPPMFRSFEDFPRNWVRRFLERLST